MVKRSQAGKQPLWCGIMWYLKKDTHRSINRPVYLGEKMGIWMAYLVYEWYIWYICGLVVYYDGFIPTNHNFAPQKIERSTHEPGSQAGNHWKHCSIGWITRTSTVQETIALPTTNMGGPADCQSNFYTVLTAGLFLFSSQTKKSWLVTASISNFASPKTPTWAWLVTPPTPRHPQRKGSRPDARLS